MSRLTPVISHVNHLTLDPTDLCIPLFNGDAYADVEVIADLEHPDAPWPEVLTAHGVRARIAARYVAHRRDCADPLCVATWVCANHRASAAAMNITFVLIADNQCPVLIPVAEYRDLLEQLAFMGHTEEAAARIDPAYRVCALTADQIRRGDPIAAAPVQMSDLVASEFPPPRPQVAS